MRTKQNPETDAARIRSETRAEIARGLTPSPRTTIHLKTADEVRLEQSKVYRLAREGKLDAKTACQLVYILSEIRRSIETSIVEAQFIELKARHERLLPDATPLPGSD